MPEQMITFNKYHARVIMINVLRSVPKVRPVNILFFPAVGPAVMKLFSFFQFLHKHFQLFNAQVIFFYHRGNNIAE